MKTFFTRLHWTLAVAALLMVATLASAKDKTFVIQMTIYSDPEVASFFLTDLSKSLPDPDPLFREPIPLPPPQLIGQTPLTIPLTINLTQYPDGCLTDTSEMLTARWPSGASAELKNVRVCAKDGKKQQLTFLRPDVPGREFDVAYALELRRLAVLKQQIRNAEQAAQWAEALQILQNSRQRANTTVHCESYVVGNMVSTNCQ